MPGSPAKPTIAKALHFASPVPECTPAAVKKMKAEDVEKGWNGALVRIGGKWLRYQGLEWKSSSKGDSSVVFSPSEERKDNIVRIKLSVIVDVEKRKGVIPQIIFGFFGGSFDGTGGLQAKVVGAQYDRSQVTKIEYELSVPGSGLDPVKEVKTVAAFLKSFQAEEYSASAPPATVDLSPYKHVTKMLRATRMLDESATGAMVADVAAFVAAALEMDSEPSPADLTTILGKLDAQIEAGKVRSPSMKRLRSAGDAGLMAGAVAGQEGHGGTSDCAG